MVHVVGMLGEGCSAQVPGLYPHSGIDFSFRRLSASKNFSSPVHGATLGDPKGRGIVIPVD